MTTQTGQRPNTARQIPKLRKMTKTQFQRAKSLLQLGYSHNEIAQDLNIPKDTVTTYVDLTEYPHDRQNSAPFMRHIRLRLVQLGHSHQGLGHELRALGYAGSDGNIYGRINSALDERQRNPDHSPNNYPEPGHPEYGLTLRTHQIPALNHEENAVDILHLNINLTDDSGIFTDPDPALNAQVTPNLELTVTQGPRLNAQETPQEGANTGSDQAGEDENTIRRLTIGRCHPDTPLIPLEMKHAIEEKRPTTVSRLIDIFTDLVLEGSHTPEMIQNARNEAKLQKASHTYIPSHTFDFIHTLRDLGKNPQEIAQTTGLPITTLHPYLNMSVYPHESTPSPDPDPLEAWKRHIQLQIFKRSPDPETIYQEIHDSGYHVPHRSIERYMNPLKAAMADKPNAEPEPVPPLHGTDNPELGLLMRTYQSWTQASPQPTRTLWETQLTDLAPSQNKPFPTKALTSPETKLRAVFTDHGNLYVELWPAGPRANLLHIGNLPHPEADHQFCADWLRGNAPNSTAQLASMLEILLKNPVTLQTTLPLTTEPQQPQLPAPAPQPEPEPEAEIPTAAVPSQEEEQPAADTLPKEQKPDTDPEPQAADPTETRLPETDTPLDFGDDAAYAQALKSAWENVPGQERDTTPAQLNHRTAQRVAQELAALSGAKLATTGTETLLQKDCSIMRSEDYSGAYSVLHHRQDQTKLITLAQTADSASSPGVRNPEFPGHVHWWQPTDGDPDAWTLTTLQQSVATFLTEAAATQ